MCETLLVSLHTLLAELRARSFFAAVVLEVVFLVGLLVLAGLWLCRLLLFLLSLPVVPRWARLDAVGASRLLLTFDTFLLGEDVLLLFVDSALL